MTFRWFKDGQPLAMATNLTLNFSNVQPASAGTYALVASNRFGTAMSSQATLRVIMEPMVTQQLQSATVEPGSNVSFSVGIAGPALNTFQWHLNGILIPGARTNPLNITNVQAIDVGQYQVEVVNFFGSVRSAEASLALLRPASETERQPQLESLLVVSPVTNGSFGTFRVIPGGDKPLHLQWFFNGQPVPGATNPDWIRPRLTLADAGAYTVEVSNSLGRVRSPAQLLAIEPLPRPGNDDFAQRLPLVPGVTTQVSRINAGLEEGEPRAFPDRGGRTVWWSCRPAVSGVLTLSSAGSSISPVLSTFTGDSLSSLVLVARDSPPASGGDTTSSFRVDAHTEYQIQVDHFNDWQTGGIVQLVPSLEPDPPAGTPPTLGAFLPEFVVMDSGSTLSIPVRATGAYPLQYEWWRNDILLPGFASASLVISNVQPSDAGQYRVRVFNSVGSFEFPPVRVLVGSNTARVQVRASRYNLTAGYPFSVNATAPGTEPVTYQWVANGRPIPGETSPNLERIPVVPSEALAISLVVSNPVGSITSTIPKVQIVPAGTRYQWSTLTAPDGSAMLFARPSGIAISPTGELYIAEQGSGLVRRVGTDGTFDYLRGPSGEPWHFGNPVNVEVHPKGHILVLNVDGAIIRWEPGQVPAPIDTQPGWGLFVDADESIWSSGDRMVSRIDRQGNRSTLIAGSTSAQIVDLARDRNGEILLADVGARVIHRIRTNGAISIRAGRPNQGQASDGTLTTGTFEWPNSVSVDSQGNIFVADEGASRIRRISPEGFISTLGGTTRGSARDGIGAAARFASPRRVTAAPDGRLYVVDTQNNLVRIGTPVVPRQRQLNARIVDSALEFSWDPGDDLCVLESSQALDTNAKWEPVDPLQGVEPVLRIPLALLEAQPQFFRLRVL